MQNPGADLLERLTVPRTDAVYNCHAYLTKVPIGAIVPFIRAFTCPGDTVLDFFAGSGMTGLAALTTGRNAELSDISRLGQHIATGYLTRVDHQRFKEAASKVAAVARAALGDRYVTRRASDGDETEMVRTVWSFTYACPECRGKLVYFEHLSASDGPPSACNKCGHSFAKRLWPRAADVPVEVVVRGINGRLAIQSVSKLDRRKIKKATGDVKRMGIPSRKIGEHLEMFSRSGLRKVGLSETADFFSARNAIALYELWAAISMVTSKDLRQKLRFCFTAILARASRRYQWSRNTPLNAQNQTYYVAPVYYEWNVFELFGRKVEAALRSDEALYVQRDLFDDSATRACKVRYTIASASKLRHLGDESIDYVFTDPPFGSNIFYSDMNLFHEAWLGEVTDPTHEAVIHTTGERKGAAATRYEELLRSAFAESHRILKPGRYMSVVFGNSSGAIWGLVQRALRECGFDPTPAHVSILDKGQRSVKGLASGSEGVATVDLVLTVRKTSSGDSVVGIAAPAAIDPSALVREVIESIPPLEVCSPSHVYAQVLRRAIKEHLPLDGIHLADVVQALKSFGFTINTKTGLLRYPLRAA